MEIPAAARAKNDPLISSILLGLAYASICAFLRRPVLWDWDELTYLYHMRDGTPANLILGRTGYVFPGHLLWLLHGLIPGVDRLDFPEVLRTANILFSALALGSFHWLIHRLTKERAVALCCAGLALAHPAFIECSLALGPDMMMLGLSVFSGALFVKAFDGSPRLTLAAAAVLGVAVNAHERALFFLPSYFVFAYFVPRPRSFSRATLIAATGVFGFTAALGPAILLLRDSDDFLRNFASSHRNSNFVGQESFLSQLELVWNTHFSWPAFSIVLTLIGAGAFAAGTLRARESRGPALALLTWSLAPALATSYFVNPGALLAMRFFLPVLLLTLFFQAIAVAIPFRIKLGKCARTALTTALVCGAIFQNGFLSWPVRMDKHEIESAAVQSLYNRLQPLLMTGPTLIISGRELAYIRYRSRIEGLPTKFVRPGWSWPGEKVPGIIESYLRDGYQVLLLRNTKWKPAEVDDLETLPARFRMTELENGIFRLGH